MIKVEQFATIMTYINGAYSNFKVSNAVWYDMLKEFDYDICFQAVKNALKEAKYPPTIASITEEYNKLVNDLEKRKNKYLLGWIEKMYSEEEITYLEYNEFIASYETNNFSEKEKKRIIDYSKRDKYVVQILGEKEKQLCLK